MKRKGAKLENAVNWVASVIGGISLVGMVVLISLNVISRFLFATSFNWAEEVTYMLFNWAVVFGVVVVYRYQGLTCLLYTSRLFLVIVLLSVLSPTKVSVTPLRKLMPVVPIKAFVILKRLSSAGSSTVKDAVFTFRRPPKEITLIWG